MGAKASSPKRQKAKLPEPAAPFSIPTLQTGKLDNYTPGIIQACVIFYNDTPELLEAMFKSVKPYVDRIIAIDGPFAEFPFDKPYSTDGCLEIAKKYADEVIECTEPWKDQMTKRTRYFTLKNPNDYYLVIDADERFRGEIPRDKLGEDCYAIMMEDHTEDGTIMKINRFRLIRHQDGIAHQHCHAEIWANGKPLIVRRRKRPYPEIDGFTIEHHPYLRPQYRQQEDAKYGAARAENKRLGSPFNNLGFVPEKSCFRMLFKGVHYAGDDGFGVTLVLTAGTSCFMSPEAADGVLESWPNDWEKLEEYNVESD